MNINAEKSYFLIFRNKTRNSLVQVGSTPSERFHISLQIFLPSFSLLFCRYFAQLDVLLYSYFAHLISLWTCSLHVTLEVYETRHVCSTRA